MKMKVVIVFSSGFHLVVTCDEFETTRNGLGVITNVSFKGMTENKPLFLNTDNIDCIYRVMSGEEAKDG